MNKIFIVFKVNILFVHTIILLFKNVGFLLYTFASLSNKCIQTIVACKVNL